MTEILSPVGSPDVLEAAVRSGADAVYLGMGDFNARRNAHNFNAHTLKTATEYCHIRGVKVYLTLNTLIYNQEFSEAVALAHQAVSAGIDGIILADLGLAEALHERYPTLPLHASTQLTVHTPEALYELKRIGFFRVVPSREMSKTELKEFCALAAQLQIEVEVFIHGALCMSMSGQCLMSATLGGRSGNRGLCAGTCRLPWKGGKNGYSLSLRDLSLIDNIKELSDMGVCSFKIEGRMKSPEYVAAVTAAAKSAVENGNPDPELMALCRDIFSRSGFTKGYYEGKIGQDMFGVRTEEDAVATREVQNKIHGLYRAERQSIPLDFHFSAKAGEPSKLTVCDGKNTAEVLGDAPEIAKNRSLDMEFLQNQLSKLGNTPYYAQVVSGDFQDNISLSAASLNALRRSAVEKLSEMRAKIPQYAINHISQDVYAETEESSQPKLVAKFRSVSQIPEDLSGVDAVIIPAEEISEYKGNLPIIADIPRGMSNRVFIEKCFEEAKRKASAVMVGNLSAVHIAKRLKIPFIAGSGMNIMNRRSLEVLRKMGAVAAHLSLETKLSELKYFGNSIPVGLEVYGRLPLMLLRNCPLKIGDCGDCKHEITDRKGIKFPVLCRGGYSEIFNSRPTILSDRLREFSGADFLILDFTTEEKEQCREIIEAYHSEKSPVGEYTRGLYGKGVL